MAGTGPASDGVPFNGTTSYAAVEDGKAFDLDAFTLAAWVKLRHAHGSQVFLNRGGPGELCTFYLYQSRVRMLVEFQGGAYTHASVPAPPKDTWVHYAGTYDGVHIEVYVDGQRKHTAAAPGRMPRSKATLFLGALNPDERHLDGWLDDVRVWRRALSGEEVARVAARSDDGALREGLVARWTKASLDGPTWKNLANPALNAAYYADPKPVCRKADGYRGIWYYCGQYKGNPYRYAYSGGLGTYCAKHRPFAVYAKAAHKTFFCYGGTDSRNSTLLHMVGCYDHATATVCRPTILLDKHTADAHDNPVISMDDKGRIFIFSSAHGAARPAYISVSTKPYAIDEFERVLTRNFSYPQPWFIEGKGFFVPHTLYVNGRRLLHQMTSPDGRTWGEPRRLAAIGKGHYQVSASTGTKVGTAFNTHTTRRGGFWRTNLYYMETDDFGHTWRNAAGQMLDLPLTTLDNPALVQDYKAQGFDVYMKHVAFDSAGHPVVLFLTSPGREPGPQYDPRTWRTARWTGTAWDIRDVTTSDHNFDMGTLRIERDDLWRVLAPTQRGPQPYCTGGEVAIWRSTDQGNTWALGKQLTRSSKYNHTYCRQPVNAHPDFYAFWADGDGMKPSPSRLYFCNQAGDRVWMLPPEMAGDTARPTPVGGHQ